MERPTLAVIDDHPAGPGSAGSTADEGAYAAALDRLLTGQPGAAGLLRRAAGEAPDDPRGPAALAVVLHRAGRRASARRWLARAAAAGGAAPSERRRVAALAAVVEGHAETALGRLQAYLAEFPRDALLVQVAAELITWSGRGDGGAARRTFLAGLAPHYAGDWWFAGEYAFELAETGRLPAARRLARRALAVRPDHAGAAHALAHVFYEAGDAPGGAAFLRAWLPGYDPRGAEHSHLTWHLALFELERGREAEAAAVYATGLDPVALPHRRLCDAASFLWRRLLAGAGTLPWRSVRDLAAREAVRRDTAFRDVHAGMAFAGAGDAASMRRLLSRLRRRAGAGDAAARVALSLTRGLDAFARGAYGEAVRRLEAVIVDVPVLGGSNAQRAVFAATLVEARRRAAAARRHRPVALPHGYECWPSRGRRPGLGWWAERGKMRPLDTTAVAESRTVAARAHRGPRAPPRGRRCATPLAGAALSPESCALSRHPET